MSMHEIEDLVEETVRLVLASARTREQQRAVIGGLYGFQAWFDTSETTGRLRRELEAIGYFDAPDANDPALLPLAAAAMEEADSAGNLTLVHHWLAAAATAISDLDLGPRLPSTFKEMLAEGSGQRMREIAIRNDVHKRRRSDFFMTLPGWAQVKSNYIGLDPETLEKRYILRFLLDHKASADRIQADYDAERKKIAALDQTALFSLPQRVPAYAPLVFLGMETTNRRRAFVFAGTAERPGPDEARLFFVIEHDSDIGLLACEVRVQSGLLSGWQGGGGDTLADTHFRINYRALVPDDEIASDRNYDPFGGWKFKLSQSQALLEKRLESIFRHWAHAERAFAFHRTPLRDVLAASTPQVLEKRRRDLRARHGFFLNDLELLFACACLEWEQGRRPDRCIAAIEEGLAFVHELYPLKAAWTSGLEKLRDGIHFPPTTETFPYRSLREE